MNYLRLTASGKDLRFDMSNSRDISIPLHFNQPQPNHFDAEMAYQKPMHGDTFVGDTRQGGSCNVSVITLTPHCNGTHTECLSHVTRQGPHIRDIAPTELQIAALVTITPTNAVKSVDRYDPNPDKSDQIITEYSLTSALAPFMELIQYLNQVFEEEEEDLDLDEDEDEFGDIPSKSRRKAKARKKRRRRSPVSEGDRGGVARTRKTARKKAGKTLTRTRIANMRTFGMDPENPEHVEAYLENNP